MRVFFISIDFFISLTSLTVSSMSGIENMESILSEIKNINRYSSETCALESIKSSPSDMR